MLQGFINIGNIVRNKRFLPPWLLSGLLIFSISWLSMYWLIGGDGPSVTETIALIGKSSLERSEPSPSDWKQHPPLKEFTALDDEIDAKALQPIPKKEMQKRVAKRRSKLLDRLSSDGFAERETRSLRNTPIIPANEVAAPPPDAVSEPGKSSLPAAEPPLTEPQIAMSDEHAVNDLDSEDTDASAPLPTNDVLVAAFGPSKSIIDKALMGKSTGVTRRVSRRNAWSGWVTMRYPLNKPDIIDDFNNRTDNLKTPVVNTVFRYQPKNLFFQLNLYNYVEQQKQGIWDPDFAYRMGWDSARPNTWSLLYINEGRNRLDPGKQAITGHYSDVKYTHPEEGTFTLRYNLPSFNKLPTWLAITDSSSIGGSVSVRSTPKVDQCLWDGESCQWQTHQWNSNASLYTWYNFTKSFYVGATFYYYPEDHQMPWHRDYGYEFGIADWSPGKLSLEYFNYSDYNRFPGNVVNKDRSSNFFDGTLSLSLYWQF